MQKIKTLRNKIDSLDEQIIKLLARRRNLSLKIGSLKSKADKPVRDISREKLLIDSRTKTGTSLKVPRKLIKTLFKAILEDSRVIQQKLPLRFDKKAKN